jgi:blue copper oxidase
MNRRKFLVTSTALGGAGLGLGSQFSTTVLADSHAIIAGKPLPIPEVIEPGTGSIGKLDVIVGSKQFIQGIDTRTQGFNQPYLGPVIRFKRGQLASMAITNKTEDIISTHWHGLHVHGAQDGGPQTAFAPGKTWTPELQIDQPAATLWYHSHVHGKTADQVYSGLAGMIIIDDPDAGDNGLPSTYGVDDLPIIVQDRAFDEAGNFLHLKRGPSLMHGFRAGEILVNGAVRPNSSVPRGLVRLRLLNASNARVYSFSFEDKRPFHQVATDGGLLPKPLTKTTLTLAPAERAEIVVDFSNGQSVRLLSAPDAYDPFAKGMMGKAMRFITRSNVAAPKPLPDDERFEIMSFSTDSTHSASIKELPQTLVGSPSQPNWGEPKVQRNFSLDMHVGNVLKGFMGFGGMGVMGINGKSMDMKVINFDARHGETELWRVTASEMAHPFHIHGTSFQVLSNNGKTLAYDDVGLKDVFLIEGEAEILVRHTMYADKHAPFMYHCHILEHEDAGMMGQFTVS